MKITPIKAIRAKCLDCSNNQTKLVRECPIFKCPLWPYRMGKRPPKETIEGSYGDEKSLATSMVFDNDDASGEEEPE